LEQVRLNDNHFQEDEEENVAWDALALELPAVELFSSPAGGIASSAASSEFGDFADAMDTSSCGDSPLHQQVSSESKNPGTKGRGKKKRSKQKSKRGGGDAAQRDAHLDAEIAVPLPPQPGEDSGL
jgi:hypothetical protein